MLANCPEQNLQRRPDCGFTVAWAGEFQPALLTENADGFLQPWGRLRYHVPTSCERTDARYPGAAERLNSPERVARRRCRQIASSKDPSQGAGLAGHTSKCVIRHSSVGLAQCRFTAVPSPATRQRLPSGIFSSGYPPGSMSSQRPCSVRCHEHEAPQSLQEAGVPCAGSGTGADLSCSMTSSTLGGSGSRSGKCTASPQHASHATVCNGTGRSRAPSLDPQAMHATAFTDDTLLPPRPWPYDAEGDWLTCPDFCSPHGISPCRTVHRGWACVNLSVFKIIFETLQVREVRLLHGRAGACRSGPPGRRAG